MEDLNKAFDKLNNKYLDYDEDSDTMYFDSKVVKNGKLVNNYELWEKEALDFIRQREKELLKEQLLELEQIMKVKINPTTPFRDIRYWIQDKLKELSNEKPSRI